MRDTDKLLRSRNLVPIQRECAPDCVEGTCYGAEDVEDASEGAAALLQEQHRLEVDGRRVGQRFDDHLRSNKTNIINLINRCYTVEGFYLVVDDCVYLSHLDALRLWHRDVEVLDARQVRRLGLGVRRLPVHLLSLGLWQVENNFTRMTEVTSNKLNLGE